VGNAEKTDFTGGLEFVVRNSARRYSADKNRNGGSDDPPFLFFRFGAQCKFEATNLALQKRGRTPRPRFASSLGDGFDVVDVRAGLRENVVKVVADADKSEPLV
jgi:hypothetical protein